MSQIAPGDTTLGGETSIAKRSLAVRGHRTSISLEAAFWRQLNHVAKARSLSLSALVGQIDAARGPANLSSAIRVFILQTLVQ